MTPPTPHGPAPATRLGPYEILGELGRGGMGVVYRARRADLQRDFALKVILAGQEATPDAVKRFTREARAAAALAGHPGIVGVHDIGEADGKVYFAMDFVEGTSLAQLIAQGELPPDQAAALLEQAARALHHAHEHGLLHRDVKPANILVTKDGRALVTDFGLAKEQAAGPDLTRLTKSGQIVGTPAYMAPEQAEAEAVDRRTDVWSLGATLYEALVGEPPFPGDTLYAVLAGVLTGDPRRPRQVDPRIPADLEAITLHCLEKRPEDRYPTADALAEDLHRFLAHQPIALRPPGAMRRVSRWLARHRRQQVALVVTLGAVAIGYAALVHPRLRASEQAVEAAYSSQARTAADVQRRAAALPHLETGRATLGRLDRLLATPDWTPAQAETLITDARACFEQALTQDPTSADTLVALGRLAASSGQPTAAIDWYTKAIQTDPTHGIARLERAIVTLELYAEARLAPDGGLRPETAATRALLAQADQDTRAVEGLGLPAADLALANGLRRFASGDRAGAAALLDAHAQAQVSDARAWNWAGRGWVLAGQPDRGEASLTKAIAFRPRDPVARFYRALAHRALGNIDGARKDLDVAVAVAPTMGTAWLARGLVRASQGDYENALRDYDAAVAAAPTFATAYYWRGKAKAAQGDIDAALADLARAIALVPDDPEVLRTRATVYLTHGQPDPARADLDQVLTLDPRDAWAYANRGLAHERLGAPDRALADYDAAVAVDPRCVAALANRGNLKWGRSDHPGALTDYEAALTADGRFVPALAGRALVREAAGDVPGALADLDLAVTVEPANATLRITRGDIRRQHGDHPGALDDLETALRLAPHDPAALLGRANVRHAAGDDVGALQDADAALATAPESWSYRDAAETLCKSLRTALGR